MAMPALAIVASLLLLVWPARCVRVPHEYVVGDVSYGWDSGAGINYDAWARGHDFFVGDFLTFMYVTSQHDLLEVTEEVYRSCNTSAGGGGNGVRAKYTSGYNLVELAEARPYWFICDFPGHCQGGMRLAVNVSDAGAAAGGGGGGSSPYGSAASTTAGGPRGWPAAGCLALVVMALMNTKALLLQT